MNSSKAVEIETDASAKSAVLDRSRAFEIIVNGQKHKIETPVVTREEVVILAKFDLDLPVCVRVHIQGTKPRVLQPNEEVDLALPGIERFRVDEECIVTVKLNATTFEIAVPITGVGIKQAAIKAGAKIELDFVLAMESADGPPAQIDDDELVFPDPGACFVAVSGDDNS